MAPVPHDDQQRSTTRGAGGHGYDRRAHGVHNLRRPEVIADPHLYIRRIHELDPVFYDETGRVWVCGGYEEAVEVLTHHHLFTSARLVDHEELVARGLTEAADVVGMLRRQLLFQDPPAHTAIRDAVKEHFTSSRVRSWDGVMREIVDKALAGLPTHGTADLITDFAAKLSSPLVTALLGMRGREDDISRWAEAYETLLGSVSTLPELRDKAILPVLDEALEAFQAEARDRLHSGQEDVLSALVRSGRPHELDQDGLDDVLRDVAANCVVLAGGGYQTLTHLVSTGLRLLDQHPEQQRLLRERPDLIDGAIEEFMRLDGSSQYVARRATTRVELGGHEIAAGESVLVHLGAANVDPRKFKDPLALDIRRREARHLGFGMGRHYCVGAPYAKRIAGIAVLQFLERFPTYHFATETGALLWGSHPNTRSMTNALVRLGKEEEDNAEVETLASTVDWSGAVRERAALVPWHVQFSEQARSYPDRVAVETENDVLTYGELDRRSNALAYQLRGFGVGPETVVGVVMERRPDLVCAVLAVAKAGAASMLADVTCPKDRLAGMLADSKAVLVLTDAETLGSTDAFALRIPAIVVSGATGRDAAPHTGVHVGNTAYVAFTSGSTGRPKAIAISHEGVSNLYAGLAEIFQLGPSDRILQFLSPNFDGFIADVVLALLSGATLVLAERKRSLVGPPLATTLRQRRITAIILTPSVWSALPLIDLPDLRIAAAAGERLTPALVDKWSAPHRRFLNIYGPAEAAALTTWHECGQADSRPPIGRPAVGKQVYVLDEQLQPVPVGVEGELCIGGIGIGRYLNRPDLMEERFAVDSFGSTPGQLLYRTGDRCRWLADGTLDYLGRADRQVKIRGQRIELNEVESVIAEFPGVSACTVYETDGRLTASLVVTGGTLDEGALRAFLSTRLHTAMIPTSFHELTDSVRTTNSKTDWQASQGEGRNDRDTSPASTPHTPPAEAPAELADGSLNATRVTWIVAGLFAQCLRLPHYRVKHDSEFFSIGGDSLSTAELLTLVDDTFGVDMDLELLFDRCTPDSLSREICRQVPPRLMASSSTG